MNLKRKGEMVIMNKEEMIKLLRTKINSDEVKDKIININNLIVDIYQEGFNICYDIMEKLYQTQLTEANEKLEKIKEYIKSKIDIHKHLIEQWEWEEENVKEYETEPSNRPYLISMNKRILEEYEKFLEIIKGSDNK